MEKVPKFDFVNLNFVDDMENQNNASADAANNYMNGNSYSLYCYQGPNQVVSRVANAVSSLGQILPIAPPAPNASWSMDYWAPSIKCDHVTDERRQDVWKNMVAYNSVNHGKNCDVSSTLLRVLPSV